MISPAYDIPSTVPHLSQADAEEIARLLHGIFGEVAVTDANKWLRSRSAYFNCAPVELLKRDELGVVRVISYLKQAPEA